MATRYLLVRLDAENEGQTTRLPVGYDLTIGSLKAWIIKHYNLEPKNRLVIHDLDETLPDNALLLEHLSENKRRSATDEHGHTNREEARKGPKSQQEQSLNSFKIFGNIAIEDSQQTNRIQLPGKSDRSTDAEISDNRSGGKAIQRNLISCHVEVFSEP
ncbi:hypothetical protein F4781DRAFT_409556 [Annulohypoxylon bovei var. microspora]|nr:hypothetical protein F4781DRAFT_409556 [Annulohypoxylon bovei var. microspora]